MKYVVLAGFLTLSSWLFGQIAVPAGTILPLRLNSAINSRKSRAGQVVSARVMQDVPLPGNTKIKCGSRILGRVISVQRGTNGSGSEIVLRFDTLAAGKHRIPLATNLRALASMVEVNDAQTPQTGPDRGTDEYDWATIQIGGEADYHGSVITNGLRTVGKSLPPAGALVQMTATPNKCRGGVAGNDRLQATWVFGSNACGLYGFSNLILAHAGRTNPVGEIVLRSDQANIHVRAGSGMLLRVN